MMHAQRDASLYTGIPADTLLAEQNAAVDEAKTKRKTVSLSITGISQYPNIP
jgi:hypothetical protein